MEKHCHGFRQQLERFYDKFVASKEFIKYFKETWEPKTGMCVFDPLDHGSTFLKS